MKTAPKTIRFWEFVNNGWVKIKIRPSQKLDWEKTFTGDEGPETDARRWVGGRTCIFAKTYRYINSFDGRKLYITKSYCPVTDLQSNRYLMVDGQKTPTWQPLD